MSLNSELDDSNENPPTRLISSKSVSSNEDHDFFNNIPTSFQRQSFQSQAEYLYNNRNPLPNVTIYPTNIHFNTTYPNKSLQSKIIISNGGHQVEDFNVTLNGDPEFSVSIQKVSLSPGETQSLIINFNPKKVSLFNSSLIFEGRTSMVAPITGHCIPSPLEYPLINSPSWTFPKAKTDKLISFANNSLAEPLSIVISTNCTAFKVTPQKFDIPPSSSCDINLYFDPKQQLVENPSISIQCPQSGDSVTIPLVIAPKKEKIIVDFGTISVEGTTKQTLKLKHPQMTPIVQWPFALENISDNGMPQDTMIFSFSARDVGDFRTKLHLTNYEVELKASSVNPPYRIKIPSSFPLRPIKIKNYSESMLNLAFSLNTSSFDIDPETADLRPNQVCELSIKSTNASVSIPDQTILKVIWSTSEGKRVIDEFQLPASLNQSLSIVDMESTDNTNYSSSQRKKASSKCKTEVSPNDIDLTANYSNSEYTTKSKLSEKYNDQIMQPANKIHKRKSQNSQALSTSSINNKNRNNYNDESISQTNNINNIEQDDIDYYSSPSKFDNFERLSQSNSYTNQQQNRNHVNNFDSFDYYEEEEEIDIQQNDKTSRSRKSIRSHEMHNKYSISLNSYEERQRNDRFNDYDEYGDDLSAEYPNSDSIYGNDANENSNTRTKSKQIRHSNRSFHHENNKRSSRRYHRHHCQHANNSRQRRRRTEGENNRRQKKSLRRNNEFNEYNYEYDYYEDEYNDINNSRKRKHKSNNIKGHRDKYYNDSASSQYEKNNKQNNSIEIEEEEEDILYSSDEERMKNSTNNNSKNIPKKQKKLAELSDYSSEDDNNRKTNANSKLNTDKNNNAPSSSFSRIEDLKTQMTQTNTIGNGLQNLGSQTLDSFDEEFETRSANTSKIQSTKNKNSISTSTSTIATSTITTDNEESIETQSYIQKKTLKNSSNQNSKSVSFTAQLAQLSQNQTSSRSVTPTTSSFSLIPFFGVSIRTPSRFELTVNSDFGIEIEAPQWIQLPKSIQPNQGISMVVSSLPSETVLSTFSVHSESGDLSLPIFAYKGSSNLIFESEIEMIEVTDSQYTAAMVVKNKGERAGFIAFMLSESSNVSLRVSPPVAIIQPKADLQVKFLVTTKSGEFTIPVVAYCGDEIVRQLQAVVAPNDYLSTAFNLIEFSNEISAFESAINDCKPRDILKIFRKSLSTSKLVFKSPQKTFSLNRVTISPSSIELANENEEGKVSLLNLSPEPLSFSVSASSDCVTFYPQNGAAPPYGEAVITASLSDISESQIVIHVGKEKFKVPLKVLNKTGNRNNRTSLNTSIPNANSYFRNDNDSFSSYEIEKRKLVTSKNSRASSTVKKNSGVFAVVEKKVEFDFVDSGSSKTIQFVIVNNETYDMNLTLKTDNQAFFCERNVFLKGDSETAIDITFNPKTIGAYDGNLLIKNDDHKIQIKLSGECANGSSSASSFITHPLEFPPCIPGTIRRAQLRVSNKTDRFVNVTARTSAPFHCPFPFFEVDPYSYVLVPVRFIPKEAGEYNGTIEFHSSNGTVSTIELNGVCIEY